MKAFVLAVVLLVSADVALNESAGTHRAVLAAAAATATVAGFFHESIFSR